MWNEFLVSKLTSLGYKASLIDDCVFYKDNIIFMVCIDDGIFLGPDDEQLIQAIRDIQNAGLNIEDQGHPADYVGVNIKKAKDRSYEFSQCALIDSIIQDVGLTDVKTKPVPAKVATLLHPHQDEPAFNLNFNYHSVVGKLNYLAQTTCPDIMYAVHQIAKYSADSREPHGKTILYLVQYLKKSRELGICFNPKSEKRFVCYCDADFSGNWTSTIAKVDTSTSKIMQWLGHLLCRMSDHLGFKASNSDRFIYHRGQVYCIVNVPTRCYSHHGADPRDERSPHPSHLH